MCVSRFAARALPIVAASSSAIAAVTWVAWLRSRHLAPVADVFAAGVAFGQSIS